MAHTKWTNTLTSGQANGIRNAMENDPSNPKHDEIHVRNGQVVPTGQHRITPRVAIVPVYTGTDLDGYKLGILVDGWSEARAAQENPAVTFEEVVH